MPYTAVHTETADVMIESFIQLKAEHQKLGKTKSLDRAHHEKLRKLATDIDTKGAKISGVLAKMIADARAQHDKMTAVVDRLLEQALVATKKAQQVGSASPSARAAAARACEQLVAGLHKQAVAEDAHCNQALMAVNRSFDPSSDLDEKYRKAFSVGRLGLHAQSKSTNAKLQKLAQLEELSGELVAQIAKAPVPVDAAKDVKELTVKVGKMLEDATSDVGQVRKMMGVIERIAAMRKVGAQDAAMGQVSCQECDALLKKTLGCQELAQKLEERAVRRYRDDLALTERKELEAKVKALTERVKDMKRMFDACAKAMIDVRRRAQA
jgi:predicted nucleic acid-binding Zn ribbon protein